MSAEYWASTHQSNENDPEERVDDNVRTDEGTISVTKNQISRGWITSSAKDLKKSLKHQHIKSSQKIQNLINRIQVDLGLIGSVRLTTNDECERAILKCGEKLPTIIRSMNTKSGIDPDYDYRLLKEVVDRWQDDPNEMIEAVIYHVGMNSDEVKTAREMKEKYSRKSLLYYATMFNIYQDNGTFDEQLNIKYMGQLDGEELYAG